MDFPYAPTEPLVTIHPYTLESLGPIPGILAGLAFRSTASAAYPTASLAIFVPFVLAKPILVKKLWCYNGTAVSGNVDVGIYDEQGTRLCSSGSTAQAGTSTLQEFNITDTVIGPGLFYLAIALDNTTGTLFRGTVTTVALLKQLGMFQQASAFALPATATFATVANDYIPVFGLSTRDVI